MEDQERGLWLDLFKWQEGSLWKNAEIRADCRNVANDLGNLWEVSWFWLLYGCMVS